MKSKPTWLGALKVKLTTRAATSFESSKLVMWPGPYALNSGVPPTPMLLLGRLRSLWDAAVVFSAKPVDNTSPPPIVTGGLVKLVKVPNWASSPLVIDDESIVRPPPPPSADARVGPSVV